MEVFTSMTTADLPSRDNHTDMTSTPTAEAENVSLVGNNTHEQYNDTDPVLSSLFMVFFFGMRLLFSGLAISGNLLTIVAVIRFERLQNPTNFFICSLATADMLAGFVTPLVIVHHALSDQSISVPICLVHEGICAVLLSMNFLTIMTMAIDRYIFIAHPLHHAEWVTTNKSFLLIGLTWTFSVGQMAIIFPLSQDMKFGMPCQMAVFLFSLAFTNILTQYVVYSSITVMCYIAIGRIAYKQGKAIAALNQPYDTYEAAMNRQHKKIAKMLVTVLGTYFMCFTPQIMVSSILRVNRTIVWLHIEKMTLLLDWANTWLNPLIYAWRSEDFKVAFRRLLGLKPSNVVHPQ